VLRAYAGDDWPPRDELRAIARRLRRHIGRHAKLRRALGGEGATKRQAGPGPCADALRSRETA
jgi:hypothetical protein